MKLHSKRIFKVSIFKSTLTDIIPSTWETPYWLKGFHVNRTAKSTTYHEDRTAGRIRISYHQIKDIHEQGKNTQCTHITSNNQIWYSVSFVIHLNTLPFSEMGKIWRKCHQVAGKPICHHWMKMLHADKVISFGSNQERAVTMFLGIQRLRCIGKCR